MSNPKGEIIFESKGKSYVFKFGTNAQVLLEDRLKMSMPKWLKNLRERSEDFGASDIRLVMWAGLYRTEKMTEEDVGDLIDDIGAQTAAKIFLDAMTIASTNPETAINGDARPPQKSAKERIGMNS